MMRRGAPVFGSALAEPPRWDSRVEDAEAYEDYAEEDEVMVLYGQNERDALVNLLKERQLLRGKPDDRLNEPEPEVGEDAEVIRARREKEAAKRLAESAEEHVAPWTSAVPSFGDLFGPGGDDADWSQGDADEQEQEQEEGGQAAAPAAGDDGQSSAAAGARRFPFAGAAVARELPGGAFVPRKRPRHSQPASQASLGSSASMGPSLATFFGHRPAPRARPGRPGGSRARGKATAVDPFVIPAGGSGPPGEGASFKQRYLAQLAGPTQSLPLSAAAAAAAPAAPATSAAPRPSSARPSFPRSSSASRSKPVDPFAPAPGGSLSSSPPPYPPAGDEADADFDAPSTGPSSGGAAYPPAPSSALTPRASGPTSRNAWLESLRAAAADSGTPGQQPQLQAPRPHASRGRSSKGQYAGRLAEIARRQKNDETNFYHRLRSLGHAAPGGRGGRAPLLLAVVQARMARGVPVATCRVLPGSGPLEPAGSDPASPQESTLVSSSGRPRAPPLTLPLPRTGEVPCALQSSSAPSERPWAPASHSSPSQDWVDVAFIPPHQRSRECPPLDPGCLVRVHAPWRLQRVSGYARPLVLGPRLLEPFDPPPGMDLPSLLSRVPPDARPGARAAPAGPAAVGFDAPDASASPFGPVPSRSVHTPASLARAPPPGPFALEARVARAVPRGFPGAGRAAPPLVLLSDASVPPTAVCALELPPRGPLVEALLGGEGCSFRISHLYPSRRLSGRDAISAVAAVLRGGGAVPPRALLVLSCGADSAAEALPPEEPLPPPPEPNTVLLQEAARRAATSRDGSAALRVLEIGDGQAPAAPPPEPLPPRLSCPLLLIAARPLPAGSLCEPLSRVLLYVVDPAGPSDAVESVEIRDPLLAGQALDSLRARTPLLLRDAVPLLRSSDDEPGPAGPAFRPPLLIADRFSSFAVPLPWDGPDPLPPPRIDAGSSPLLLAPVPSALLGGTPAPRVPLAFSRAPRGPLIAVLGTVLSSSSDDLPPYDACGACAAPLALRVGLSQPPGGLPTASFCPRCRTPAPRPASVPRALLRIAPPGAAPGAPALEVEADVGIVRGCLFPTEPRPEAGGAPLGLAGVPPGKVAELSGIWIEQIAGTRVRLLCAVDRPAGPATAASPPPLVALEAVPPSARELHAQGILQL
eukprot:tig00020553_g10774.t1